MRFGLEVTVLGLTIVFGLLTAMWLLLSLALRLDGDAAAPQPPTPAAVAGSGPVALPMGLRPLDGGAEPEPALVAAIAVAVARHAAQRRREAAPAMRSYWPGSLLFASRWVAAGRMRQNGSWRGHGR